jgi:hypothetical protein
MSIAPKRSLSLPAAGSNFPPRNSVECDGVVVVVGSNGSGKTRLGVWLENANPNTSLRVSAQKSLTFPDAIRPRDLKEAEHQLLYGHLTANNRAAYRWGQNQETSLLNDYERLVEYLFSEEHDQSVRYRLSMKGSAVHTTPPETKLDIVKRIWEEVLPMRELVISGGRVEARKRGDGNSYHAKQMSDGERVIFYLIGEALSVPAGGVFIVDEPELHLHRSLQARLWDAIEAERAGCLFVYLTHDLDFAASRKGAATIWLREYSSNKWEWDVVPESDAFTEPMMLELLGSRKPILFVEGNKGSLDYFVYGKLYPKWTIFPCGSCDQVIHATASFAALSTLHSNKCHGLVDADARSLDSASKLKQSNVEVLPFAEIENLFLIEPVIRFAAKALSLDEADVVAKVQQCLLDLLAKQSESVASSLTANELEGAFREFDAKVSGKTALEAAFKGVAQKVDAAKVYEKWEAEISRVIATKDYGEALRYYSNKGLASAVGHIFKTPLRDLVLRKLRSPEAAQILPAMQAAVPQLT